MSGCLICKRDDVYSGGCKYLNYTEVRCPDCGEYFVENSGIFLLKNYGNDEKFRLLMRHLIQKKWAYVDVYEDIKFSHQQINDELNAKNFPNPNEQLELLILWLGKLQKLKNYEHNLKLDLDKAHAIIGKRDFSNLTFILDEAQERKLIKFKVTTNEDNTSNIYACLTLDGWKKHDNLRKSAIESKQIFMAMPYDDQLLDKIYYEFYKPTVKETGFDLKRVDENPEAGIINNRIIVEIFRSKLVLAELTNSNKGVYWEAGFAEGKGIPVIYTCNKDYQQQSKIHFNIRNHQIIFWSKETLPSDMDNLKAAIIATLPTQANLDATIK